MIHRLLARRIISTFSTILAVLTTALAAMQIVRLGPLFLGPWVGLSDSMCLLAVVPFLAAAIPAALAIAMAIEAGAMSRRGERQAIAASGITASRVAAAPVMLAVAGGAVVGFLSVVATPAAMRVLVDGLASLAARAAVGSLRAGRFADLPGGGVIYASRVEARDGTASLEDMLIGRDEDGLLVVTTARQARLIQVAGEPALLEMDRAHVSIEGVQGAASDLSAGKATLPIDLGAAIRARTGEVPSVLAAPTADLASALHGDAGLYHLTTRLAEPAGAMAILLLAAWLFAYPVIRRPAGPVAMLAAAIMSWHALARGSEEAFHAGLVDGTQAAWIPVLATLILLGLPVLLCWRTRRTGRAIRRFCGLSRP